MTASSTPAPSGAKSGFRRPEAPARDRIHKRKLGPDNGASVQGDVALADVRALNPVQTVRARRRDNAILRSIDAAAGRPSALSTSLYGDARSSPSYDVARVTAPSDRAEAAQTLFLSVQRPP